MKTQKSLLYNTSLSTEWFVATLQFWEGLSISTEWFEIIFKIDCLELIIENSVVFTNVSIILSKYKKKKL